MDELVADQGNMRHDVLAHARHFGEEEQCEYAGHATEASSSNATIDGQSGSAFSNYGLTGAERPYRKETYSRMACRNVKPDTCVAVRYLIAMMLGRLNGSIHGLVYLTASVEVA